MIGKQNLNSFINSGFNHLHISPDKEAMRILNKIGFEKMGFPYYGWLISIHTAIVNFSAIKNTPYFLFRGW